MSDSRRVRPPPLSPTTRGHSPALKSSLKSPSSPSRSPLVQLGGTIVPQSARGEASRKRVGALTSYRGVRGALKTDESTKEGVSGSERRMRAEVKGEGSRTTGSSRPKLASPPSSPPSDIENMQIGQPRSPQPAVRFGSPSTPRPPLREVQNVIRSPLASSIPLLTPIPTALRPRIPPHPLSIFHSGPFSSGLNDETASSSDHEHDYEEEGSSHAWFSGNIQRGSKPTSPAAWISKFGEGPRSFGVDSPTSSQGNEEQDMSEVSLASLRWEEELIEEYGRLGEEEGAEE